MRHRLTAAATSLAIASGLLLVGTSTPAEAGELHVKLNNTSDGKVHVAWDAAPGSSVSYWVQIATDRQMTMHSQRFDVPPGDTSLDVPHASLVTPYSGDYTFVKVHIDRPGTANDSGTPTDWIKPTPVAPPTTGSQVRIATFNIRRWAASDAPRKKRTPVSWTVRRAKIASTIKWSGAGVVFLQEASGSSQYKVAGKLWQFQDLARRLPTKYKLTSGGLYTNGKKVIGSQGARILYDTTRYQLVTTGYLKPPAFSPAGIRWQPWALLRDRVSHDEFYAVSAHLESGADPSTSRRLYDMRGRQATFLALQLKKLAATGRGVYLGGDFNSTSNTKPDNNVHRILVASGWYDSFATTRIVRGAGYPTTNDFHFPVKPGPFRRDYIMSLGAPAGSYWYANYAYNTRSTFASDHFMQMAQLPVKAGPYGPVVRIGSATYVAPRR